MPEVRFDRMVPSQIVARREACNLAYLPGLRGGLGHETRRGAG